MSSSVAMPVAPDALKRAVYARRDHFLAHVATLTMKQARRLIETDLGLDAKALDEEATKAAVAKYVDRVLASGDGPPEKIAAASKENRAPVRATKSPAPSAQPRTEDADEDADEEEEPDADSEDSGSREKEEDSDASEPPSTKKRRVIEPSTNKTTKKKRAQTQKKKKPAPVAGVVATLRDVCKRAGLTYTHVFMRHKDDDGRIESLRGILRENGLDGNASDARIAKVRARVELARDLDGIDQSNVIEGSRRRRAVATNDPWGQAVSYAERGGDDDDSESDDDDDDDDDDVSDADDADAEKKSSDSEVEPADLFFDDDDGDEAPVDAGPATESKPGDTVAPKAPRRGGALYSDSDEE